MSKISEWLWINAYYLRENYYELKYSQKGNVNWAEDYEQFFQEYSPAFVLSSGRCGTQLLTKLLTLEKNSNVYHSHYIVPSPLFKLFQSKAYRIKDIDRLTDIFEAARSETIYRSYRTGRQYVETNDRITFFAFAIKNLFPKAKFIHLVRNPIKVVISYLRRKNYQNFDSIDIGLPRLNTPQWEQMGIIEKNAWRWNETQMFIERVKLKYPASCITIKAEDLFKNISTTKKIFSFLGFDCPHDKKITKIIAKPMNKQILGEYKKYSYWSASEKEQIRQAATLSEKYGYKL